MIQYKHENLKKLQDLTGTFLKSAKIDMKSEIENLRSVLRFHEYRYYVQTDPLISDFEYDTLYKKLEQFEKEKNNLMKQALAENRQRVLIKFLESLKAKAKVKINNAFLEES